MRSTLLALAFATTTAGPALAALDAAAVNGADPLAATDKASTLRLEVLLDRAGASPGAIDGVMDATTEAAIAAFETMRGLQADGKLDADTWSALSDGAGDAVGPYTITAEDVGFEPSPPNPESYAEMAKRERMGYHSYAEALAEKFHMSEELLNELNPGADFAQGSEILVAMPGDKVEASVDRVEVDKDGQRVRAYSGDKLVFEAPATVGSEENPSPTGTMKVTAIAPDPNYTFNPENIEGSTTKETVIVPPGPNGPVGSTWIDLGKPTYGIHGTPYPSKINAMESNGCVRLTNWDAEELAGIVRPEETVVEFVGG